MSGLEGFGITLRRLTREDLDTVAPCRDDPKVLELLNVCGPVTDEMLCRRFESVDNENHHCWLVWWQDKPIGLTRISVCNDVRKIGEGELLLWAKGRDSLEACRVAVVALDWCFGQLGLETVTSPGAGTDQEAIRFNLALGYVLDPEVPGSETRTCRLTREAYERARPRLVRRILGLEGFGIRLRRLNRDDLELVRRWRNDPEIRRYMAFCEHITEEMQQQWFETIDNERNHYSVVLWKGEPIGLSHVKNCDLEEKTGEGGLFLWAKEFRNSTYAMRVAIVGSDWCFYELGLKTITGTVLKTNRRAIRFNTALGHVIDPEVQGSKVRTCRLTREAYERARPGLVALFR